MLGGVALKRNEKWKEEFVLQLTDDGWMLQGASTQRLHELLTQFEELAVSKGAPVDRLAPGLPAEVVRAKLAAADYGCPDELAVFYGWHNGYTDEAAEETCLAVPDMIFSPLDRLIYDAQRTRQDGDDEDGLGIGHSRILLNQDSWGVCVETAGPPHEPPIVVFAAVGYSSRPETHAVSLCTVVAWWIEEIRDGGRVWTGNSWEEGDRDKYPATRRLAEFYG